MLTKTTKFGLALGFQLAVILIMVIVKVSVLMGGTEVLLRIEPVDPRDWLRGDYVTFRYDASTIPAYLVSGRQQVRNGDLVYVVLADDRYSKYMKVRNIQLDKPKSGEIFIKGRVESGGGNTSGMNNWSSNSIRVAYGIEQYFIPEGTGRNMSFWNRDAGALVALDEDGNAVLKQIYVDNKPWP